MLVHASLPCPFDPIPFPFVPMGYRSAVSEVPTHGSRHSQGPAQALSPLPPLGGSSCLSPPNPKPRRELMLPAQEFCLFPSFQTPLGGRQWKRRGSPPQEEPQDKLGGTRRESIGQRGGEPPLAPGAGRRKQRQQWESK